MYSAAVAACGYRGHGMQIAAEAGINFTHVAWLVRLRELAKTPEGTADADTRAAILRSAHKVAKAAKYPILVLAMKSVFVRAATLSNSLRELPDEKVSVAVRELDKELGGNELESYWNDFRKVRFASRAAEEGASIEGALSRVSSQPFDALTLLFVALLSFPASFLAVGISRAKLKFFGAGKSQEARKLWVLWTIVLTVAIAAVVVATSYPSSAGFTTVGSTSGQALGSGGTVVGVCALMIAVALIMLPRRGSAPLVVLALLWSAVPALYLVHIVQSLQVDQQLGQYQRQLPEELSRVRGDWS